jgi:hypothetical protein
MIFVFAVDKDVAEPGIEPEWIIGAGEFHGGEMNVMVFAGGTGVVFWRRSRLSKWSIYPDLVTGQPTRAVTTAIRAGRSPGGVITRLKNISPGRRRRRPHHDLRSGMAECAAHSPVRRLGHFYPLRMRSAIPAQGATQCAELTAGRGAPSQVAQCREIQTDWLLPFRGGAFRE